MTITGYTLKVDVEELHIMEEPAASRGTFVVPAAATNTTYVCKHGTLAVGLNPNLYSTEQLASEDPAVILPTLKEARLALAYQPQSPAGITFLERGMNAIGGDPNPKTTFSCCFKVKIGGTPTQYYYKLKHCLIGAPGWAQQGGGMVGLGFVGDGPWQAVAPIYGKVHAFDVTAPVNWTFVDVPGTDPLMRSDAGASPLTINVGANYTPVLVSASVGVLRRLAVIPGTGATGEWGDIYPVGRRCMLTCVSDLEDVTGTKIHDATWAGTPVTTSALTIKTATHLATLTGGRLGSYGIDFDLTDEVGDAWSHLATSMSLT